MVYEYKNSVVIEESDQGKFSSFLEQYLLDGYVASSTSCGFCNSETYGFGTLYQAILIKKEK